VPPNQAEAMVQALKDKGLPFEHLLFEGAQHAFRRSQNIKRPGCRTVLLFGFSLQPRS